MGHDPRAAHSVTAARGDLIVYSNDWSSADCDAGPSAAGPNALGRFMDVIAVPLANPADASLIHREPLAGPTAPALRTPHLRERNHRRPADR